MPWRRWAGLARGQCTLDEAMAVIARRDREREMNRARQQRAQAGKKYGFKPHRLSCAPKQGRAPPHAPMQCILRTVQHVKLTFHAISGSARSQTAGCRTVVASCPPAGVPSVDWPTAAANCWSN